MNEIKQLLKTQTKENKILFILNNHRDLIYFEYDNKKYKSFYKHLLKVYQSMPLNEINIEFEYYFNGCDNRFEIFDQCLHDQEIYLNKQNIGSSTFNFD